MKIAFVTDTGTGQHPDYWEEKGIIILPLQLHVMVNQKMNIPKLHIRSDSKITYEKSVENILA